MCLLCLTFALLVSPTAEHRLCERGQDTAAFHALTTRFADLALFPFGIALALNVGIGSWTVSPSALTAAVAGTATGIVILGLWYGVELYARRRCSGFSWP